MTPEQKAVELINKFRLPNGTFLDGDDEPKNSYKIRRDLAKACAIICVDEILSQVSNDVYTVGRHHKTDKEYWALVRESINNLP